jgi:hypothetical protein
MDPTRFAVSVAVFPEQIVVLATLIVSVEIAWLVSPAPPRVAPLGGNSVSAFEFVSPLAPPFAVLVIAPDEMAM